ncbi:nucleotide exchange factor GrpE [Gottschalkia acidurici 9a]|uniref:Protein GrpE n=1 Tax=Gottschalkia acidurici (strain ATCC 7906 / DSM 604 / BCRC 14475 / CIP 104303 / KCTC 5404 / NCIMB 10678 / 9a) TaxID=1128398 RepID=K0B2J8_GOTA9|nr:nucleotide exchange factor GrpE [Gottschalkia acidurici 9a]
MQNEDLENKDEVKEEANDNIEATVEEAKEDINNSKDNVEDESSKKEIEELNNRLLRLQADFNNYKKRVEKEKEAIVSYAVEGLVTELLNALDNFDRALEVEYEENSKAFYEGVEMVHKQLLEILSNNGLEEIESLNQKFDHNYHYAVSQQESNEHDEDTVIQILSKGYKLKDKVIRPSMVIVSK